MANDQSLTANARALAGRVALDTSGPAAIPRRNGEPVFEEPWQSRIFGLAVVLCEQGYFEWNEFRERLIAEIAAADAQAAGAVSGERRNDYYEHFLAALEHLLVDKGICATTEIAQKIKMEQADKPS